MYAQTPDRRPLLKQQREGNVSSQQLLDRTPIHFEKSNILELGFESADSEGAQVEERKQKDVELFGTITPTSKAQRSTSNSKEFSQSEESKAAQDEKTANTTMSN